MVESLYVAPQSPFTPSTSLLLWALFVALLAGASIINILSVVEVALFKRMEVTSTAEVYRTNAATHSKVSVLFEENNFQ